ncbi:hypothetical protein C8J57DRAFT_112944 [Mycena rebaudengoi]|nr:hypothetical protein C8J57DRAFT_112944 [Mycena rebaudengoi]
MRLQSSQTSTPGHARTADVVLYCRLWTNISQSYSAYTDSRQACPPPFQLPGRHSSALLLRHRHHHRVRLCLHSAARRCSYLRLWTTHDQPDLLTLGTASTYVASCERFAIRTPFSLHTRACTCADLRWRTTTSTPCPPISRLLLRERSLVLLDCADVRDLASMCTALRVGGGAQPRPERVARPPRFEHAWSICVRVRRPASRRGTRARRHPRVLLS